MLSKDKPRTAVIRQIESEVAVARSASDFAGDVDDDLYEQTIRSYVKKMEKARQEYLGAGERGVAQAEKLAFEVDYLSRWLPDSLSEDQTRAIVAAAITELGADDPKMAGRVVGHIMKAGTEGLDGGLVNRIVREELERGGTGEPGA